MKADEYREWQAKPAHERISAISEVTASAISKMGYGRAPTVPISPLVDLVTDMKTWRAVARKFLSVRAPVIAASALVGLTAQALNLSLPICIISAAVTQIVFFTLQRV